jgi:hypothetical protein
MKRLLLISALMTSASLLAAPVIPREHQVGSITVTETTPSSLGPIAKSAAVMIGGGPGGKNSGGVPGGNGSGEGDSQPEPTPEPTPREDRLEKTGRVIQTARDIVALGEAIYELVKKGKPSNVTEYAPISVVPRDPMTKEIVDVFELEGFSMPVEKSFLAKVKNVTGQVVVDFNYKVIYSYGGSYNGAGKFITNVLVVPGSVKTSYGWEFNSTMKLSGIMNHGTKADPVAGVMVTIKYQMNSWSAAHERNDTIYINGRGEFKNHMIQ